MAVPLFDTAAPLAPLREELRAAVSRVLDSERYILGPEVKSFEEEFAAYCGAEHAIGVANGTDALTIALRAMGVGPGDEVVVPSFTFYASAEAIPPTGATPVFCDVDPETYCVTADTVRAAVTPRTRAVIAVHLFGNVAPVAEIEALGLPVLEDAAQAAGSIAGDRRAGALGSAATFSFFPSKNLGCFGDGGMITTVRRADRRARPDAALPRLARQGHLRAGRLQLPPGRASGGDPARAAAPPRRLGRGPPAGRPPLRGRRARRARRRCRGRRGTPRRRGICTSSAHPQVERLEAALAAADVGHKAYYRTPIHRQAAMRAWAADRQATRNRRGGRQASRDPDEPAAHRASRSPRWRRRCAPASSASARAGPARAPHQ